MKIKDNDKQQIREEIYQKLNEAEIDISNGDKGVEFRKALKKVRKQ